MSALLIALLALPGDGGEPAMARAAVVRSAPIAVRDPIESMKVGAVFRRRVGGMVEVCRYAGREGDGPPRIEVAGWDGKFPGER